MIRQWVSPDIDFVKRSVVDELLDDVVERRELAHVRPRDAVVALLVPCDGSISSGDSFISAYRRCIMYNSRCHT